MNYLSFVQGTA